MFKLMQPISDIILWKIIKMWILIINEKELRHEMRSKNEKIPALMKLLSKN